MGGGKGGSSASRSSDSEKALAKIAGDVYGQTQPLRDWWLQTFSDVENGQIPTQMAGPYAAMRAGPEAQFGVARNRILETMPRGGVQQSALANLETQRAQEVGGINAKLIEDLLNKSFGMATGAPQTSLAGYSSAAQADAQRKAAYYQMQGAKGQGLGEMIGQGAALFK